MFYYNVLFLLKIITTQGKAIFITAKNGKFQFLWKTSFVCFNNKLIEFDKNTRAITSNVHNKDFVNSNIISMKNILITKQVSTSFN